MSPETIQALAVTISAGVVTAIGTIAVVSKVIGRVAKGLERIPELESEFKAALNTITHDNSVAMGNLNQQVTNATTTAAEALRSARAAHDRADKQRDQTNELKLQQARTEERVTGLTQITASNQNQILQQLADLKQSVDSMLKRELERNK